MRKRLRKKLSRRLARTIRVTLVASEEFESLLATAERLKLDLDGFVEAFQVRFGHLRELFLVRQIDGYFRTATGAREIRLSLEPSEAFCEFMAAFTFNIDSHVIQ